mmetsp:Transcript_39570/g.61733  ORF Transcript_39570/g.61733 Transcript_39570/m.61733 type:complete len:214 (-) Transcript_39570:57-698(-)
MCGILTGGTYPAWLPNPVTFLKSFLIWSCKAFILAAIIFFFSVDFDEGSCVSSDFMLSSASSTLCNRKVSETALYHILDTVMIQERGLLLPDLQCVADVVNSVLDSLGGIAVRAAVLSLRKLFLGVAVRFVAGARGLRQFVDMIQKTIDGLHAVPLKLYGSLAAGTRSKASQRHASHDNSHDSRALEREPQPPAAPSSPQIHRPITINIKGAN